MANRTDFAEERIVEIEERASGEVFVRETTSGESTYAIFGSDTWSHEMSIPTEAREAVAEIVGTHTEKLKLGLEAFFSRENVFLTDLMDRLDMARIAYTYSASLEDGGVIRGQA